MKTVLMIALSLMSVSLLTTVMAASEAKKMVRNDRVSVVYKQIPQFDINPFVDSKRVVRNDRISYNHPKAETEAAPKIERITRNDRVVISKMKTQAE